MLVAQLSDPHIVAPGKLLYGRLDTADYLSRAVAAVNALSPLPDVTVITGDLVEDGDPAEYERFRELIRLLRMPVYVIPGNHDAREPLRRAFAADGYLPPEGLLHYAVEALPVRLVALDTTVAGQHHGLLAGDSLDWIDRTLAAVPDKPTLVMMHHPPFATGIDFMDRYGLKNPAEFATVIARHPQVERILCGHLHRAIDRRFAGTVAGTAPGTAHQMRLNLNPGEPLRYMLEPPGYQLHLCAEDGGVVTHTAVFGDWPGPHSLRAG